MADESANIWTSYSTRDRTLLTIGAVASYWIFSNVARIFALPRDLDHQASLMLQPAPVIALLVAAVVLVACVLLTSFFAGIAHFEGGLFCAAIGMVALSVRGGPMRYVLMRSPDNGVFVKLIFELVLLFVFVALGWLALRMLRERGLLRAEPQLEDEEDAMPAQGAIALAGQVVVMVFLMLIMTQTDKKAQVIWSVALSAYLAALGAHSVFPARPSIWFWPTSLIVGLIGYALALAGGETLPGGAVDGLAPALARPLPLDYASVGVAGSLLGYWTARRWQHEREHESKLESEEGK